MAKRYYWLKLPDNWFQQKSIKKLRKIAGGDTYTIIYLKMLLVAIKQDGKLFFEGVEESFYEELALEIDEEPENVRIALEFLRAQRLVELVETDEYSLPEAVKLTGSESASAERMRRLREKRASQCDIDVTQALRLGDVEIEIEKEKREYIYTPEQDKSAPEPAHKKQSTDVQYPYKAIIDRLNEKAGTAFRDKSRDTRKHIRARFEENYSLEDFFTVIDKKTAEWAGTEYAKFLRPSTLFGPKFESYLNQKEGKPVTRNGFNNFTVRKYDYDKLEQDLINAQSIK